MLPELLLATMLLRPPAVTATPRVRRQLEMELALTPQERRILLKFMRVAIETMEHALEVVTDSPFLAMLLTSELRDLETMLAAFRLHPLHDPFEQALTGFRDAVDQQRWEDVRRTLPQVHHTWRTLYDAERQHQWAERFA